MNKGSVLLTFIMASHFVATDAASEEISCKVIVESGDFIGGRNYYERFDENPKRVITKFNFHDGYFINYLGDKYVLSRVAPGIYEMESSERNVRYLAEGIPSVVVPSLVIEIIVEPDAVVQKVFECE